MSKVKIEGHASGSGTLTIQAPNTSSSRTITLPDETGTVSLGVGIDDNADATAITIDSSENVGIGETTMQANLHVKKGDSAALVHASAALYIENSGDAILQIGSPNSNVGRILFSDPEDNNIGDIKYTHSTDTLSFRTNNANQLELTSDGRGLSQFTAKAWCNFDGTGTPAFRDSHNCSSLTDISTGNWTVVYTNAIGANNCIVGQCKASAYLCSISIPAAANSDNIRAVHNNGTTMDVDYAAIAVFGD